MATIMARYNAEASLFQPVTVLLFVDADGVVTFEYV